MTLSPKSKLQPLFNKCLIEIVDEYEGLVKPTEEDVQKGILRDCHIWADHLTTSTGYAIQDVGDIAEHLKNMIGKIVFWEQYGEAGNVIEHDNKRYALVPFYRLIACEEAL